MSASPFTGRAVLWMAGVGAVSLLFAGVLALFGDEIEDVISPEANSFSRSAIGHHAFAEVLRKLEIPVVVSRHDSAARASGSAVLVLIEPDVSEWGEGRKKIFEAMRDRAQKLLVVLPRRWGIPDPLNRRWLAKVQEVADSRPDHLLEELDVDGEVTRLAKPVEKWSSAKLPLPTLAAPQLVDTGDLTPLVEAEQGVLAGERIDEQGRRLVVIADPDLLSTHGLGKGHNAELAVALLERLRGGDGTVVIDETLHGLDLEPSLGRELLRFPLVLALFQTLLAAAALIWAGLGRFGKPSAPPPAFAPGKEVLVANTAELLRYGGHLAHAVRRYWKITQEQIARELHAPAGLEPVAFRRWLGAAAAGRGAGKKLQELESRMATFTGRHRSEQEALQTSLAIHRFREEMVDGSRNHPRRQ